MKADVTEKLIELVKRFHKLEAERKDLDFRLSQWCKDARECFADDRRFIAWCKADVGLTDAAAQDLCLRARAAAVVTDAKTWGRLGEFRQIRSVEGLTKRQQVEVLEAAKALDRPVRSIVRERYPEPLNTEFTPISTAKKREMNDIEKLARFIANHAHKLPDLPGDIEVIVRMYVPALIRKRAA